MAIGAGSKGEEPITAINVTPLVDVCLVLVIIFMAVAPMAMTMGIKVLESRAGVSTGAASAEENVTVKLDISGRLTVNGALVPDGAQLQPMISAALAKSKDRMVIITADDGNKVREVVEILDTAKLAGALKLAILKTETVPAPGSKG